MTPEMIAILLTAAGAPIASAAIWAVIDMVKSLTHVLDGHERLAAFVGSIVVVVTALVVGIAEVPPRYATGTVLDVLMLVIGACTAVYGIARLAMAIHDDVNRKANSITGPSVG